jgi:hypothetical protein
VLLPTITHIHVSVIPLLRGLGHDRHGRAHETIYAPAPAAP